MLPALTPQAAQREPPMTPDEFRALILAQPGVTEGAHMGHADFRLNNRIFATLGVPSASHAMVNLHPEQQQILLAAEPDMFKPANGAWGRKGSTLIQLDRIDSATAESAIRHAIAKNQEEKSKSASFLKKRSKKLLPL
jgi:hypothetical protein